MIDIIVFDHRITIVYLFYSFVKRNHIFTRKRKTMI